MYWLQILTEEKHEPIYKCYQMMKLMPVRHDWIYLLEEDKNTYNLQFSDNEVRHMSKNKFKSLVSKAINNFAFSNLLSKASKQTKCQGIIKNIDVENISTQKYLLTEKLLKEEQQLLFVLRCKAFEVKSNFRYKYEDLTCRACRITQTVENESHFCTTCVVFEEEREGLLLQIDDIYGSLNSQIKFIKKFKLIARKWKLILELCQTI